MDAYAFRILKSHRGQLNRQQYNTIKGQILAGDTVGALKGMRRLLEQQKETSHGAQTGSIRQNR